MNTPYVDSIVDSDFEERVLRSPQPVLVAFRASWCLPSQQLIPVVDEIAEELHEQVRFVVVDADFDTSVIRRKYKVKRLPVTMLFENGRCVDCIGGMTSKDVILEMIKPRLNPVLQVDEYNFDAEVLNSPIPVLVHFDAAWCNVSQSLVPTVDRVAEKFKGKAKSVRVEFGPETARLCARFGVRRVPTLATFVDGQIEDQILGGMVGGTKTGEVTTSCVGLNTFENIEQMLEPFVL